MLFIASCPQANAEYSCRKDSWRLLRAQYPGMCSLPLPHDPGNRKGNELCR